MNLEHLQPPRLSPCKSKPPPGAGHTVPAPPSPGDRAHSGEGRTEHDCWEKGRRRAQGPQEGARAAVLARIGDHMCVVFFTLQGLCLVFFSQMRVREAKQPSGVGQLGVARGWGGLGRELRFPPPTRCLCDPPFTQRARAYPLSLAADGSVALTQHQAGMFIEQIGILRPRAGEGLPVPCDE